MTNDLAAVAPRLPVPMGVIAETGQTHPPLTDVHPEPEQSPIVLARTRRRRMIAFDAQVDDPMDLAQAGWCALFAADADPAIKDALAPLLEWRRGQVGDERAFKIFDGPNGVRPGQGADAWAARQGVSLAAPVSPRRGVPYYLTIVGPPSRIPFEFQAQFDLQWAVGRISFDRVEDYAAYAQKIVDYEKGLAEPRRRRIEIWMPRNPLDMATPLLAGTMVPEFLGQVRPGDQPVGSKQGFDVRTWVGEGQATKAQLGEIFTGTVEGGPPAIVFAGCHGAEWSSGTPDLQRMRQGALVTQEWTVGQPLEDSHYFAASDLPADSSVHGAMVFLFACFGGGCPRHDSYFSDPQGEPLALAPEPMVSQLPQRLLSLGALAVVAHVDRAFSYGFEDVMGTPQSQLLRTPLELLARGRRVGLAADPLNLQWSTLAAQLGMVLGRPGEPTPRTPLVTNLVIARDDARNYMVLGDPAVRLQADAMTEA